MKEIVHSDQWQLKSFSDLNEGDLFVLRAELIEMIDQELAKPAEQRVQPEVMIETNVCRRIPPINLGDDQIRNAVVELNQAWRFVDDDAVVIMAGTSAYMVDQVRAQLQEIASTIQKQESGESGQSSFFDLEETA